MTAAELQPFALSQCPRADIICADTDYSGVIPDWIFGPFAKTFLDVLSLLNETKYVDNSNDCDDFARLAAAIAQAANNQTPWKPANTALMFGEFWYFINADPAKDHAINVFVYYVKSTPTFGFFEPQGAIKKVLTESEITSCNYIRF